MGDSTQAAELLNIPLSLQSEDFQSTVNSTAPLPPHRSHTPSKNAKRSSPFQFGQRYLESSDEVFDYNAWDHVIPDQDHEKYCQEQYALQRQSPVTEFDRKRFNDNPAKWWDIFYKQKSTTFFKDRKWLHQEFPVLNEVTRPGAGRKVLLEVGAGAGNTAFPVLRANENDELQLWAVDYSKSAVATIRASPEYDERRIRAEVWDLAASVNQNGDPNLPDGLQAQTVDVVIMIFVLSALSPDQWKRALHNIWSLLKPGGQVLFRDYGRGDLAQVRFKAGRWMGENFYVRGDGTRVYFFDKDELELIWTGQSADNAVVTPEQPRETTPQFMINDLATDRRMIVNRQKKIKMHRCWIQGRFTKPFTMVHSDSRPNSHPKDNTDDEA